MLQGRSASQIVATPCLGNEMLFGTFAVMIEALIRLSRDINHEALVEEGLAYELLATSK
jgi:hypothetical protein